MEGRQLESDVCVSVTVSVLTVDTRMCVHESLLESENFN